MGIRRLITIVGKELLHGPRGFILVMVVAAPLLITLVINLVVGDLFSGTPQLGIYEEQRSGLTGILENYPQIDVKQYDSAASLKSAVDRGAVDTGIVLPTGLDNEIQNGQKTTVTLYTWGESLAKDRIVIMSTLLQATREFTGQSEAITINTITIGDAEATPWSQRLMPLTIMMAVFFGGLMMPAVSLIEEKQKRTLQALAATPVSVLSILIAKGIVGALLSLVMGIFILLLNRAWGDSPVYLLLMLIMASIMAAETGLILGTMIRDINTLFAVWKFGGLLIFGPAIIYMFPGLPQWIGYLFPTYYIVRPIMDLSLGTAGSVTLWLALVGVVFLVILALLQVKLAERFTAERPGSMPRPAEV